MNVWRVNTRTQSLSIEPTPKSWEHYGGRALLARILLDEGVATHEPLGPGNKLVFAPGLLVGHRLSSCDRISVGGKSPLTGGIKEANAGGRTGYHMTFMGMKALILEDRPEGDGWWTIVLTMDGIRFESADDIAGMGVYEAAPKLVERYGDKVAISLIGQGGEMLMASAGIQNIDKDHVPSRIAARGGLGAVMGSKRIKAIVFDESGGERPPIQDKDAFRVATREFTKALQAHPVVESFKEYGTAGMTRMCDGFGALPTRNFSVGKFEGAEKISGESLRDMFDARPNADPSHACMAGCVIQCSNVFTDEVGDEVVSPVEYETIGLMGSNLGIDLLDDIARLNYHVNDLGLDSIEIGAALGVCCEAGLMEYGDAARGVELIDEIRKGTALGRIIGNGAGMVGKVYGVERVPVVKNQAISAYDPRAIKGTGVTYATSPQGADHTAGLTIRLPMDHTAIEGQVEASRNGQRAMAGLDSLGVCIFTGGGWATSGSAMSDLLNARYGWDVENSIQLELGQAAVDMEREFNRLAGFTKEDDRLPEWMTREALPPLNVVFDVPYEDVDTVFDW